MYRDDWHLTRRISVCPVTLKVWSATSALTDVERMDSSYKSFWSWKSLRKMSQSESSLGQSPMTKSLNVSKASLVDSSDDSNAVCPNILCLSSQCLRNCHCFSMQSSSWLSICNLTETDWMVMWNHTCVSASMGAWYNNFCKVVTKSLHHYCECNALCC